MAIYVFLHDGYADWELGFLLPEFVFDKRQVITFGLTGEPVRSMGNLLVTPEIDIRSVNLENAEALVLPGGQFWRSFSNAGLADLVQRARASKTLIGAICDATGYMAQLGMLDSIGHTGNGIEFNKSRAPGYRGEHLYRKSLATQDDGVITASGEAALEFTYEFMTALKMFTPESNREWFEMFKNPKP